MSPAHTDEAGADLGGESEGTDGRARAGRGVVVLWVLLLVAGVGGVVAYAELADDDDDVAVDGVEETTTPLGTTSVPDLEADSGGSAAGSDLSALVGEEVTVQGEVVETIGSSAAVVGTERFGEVLVIQAAFDPVVGDVVAVEGGVERFDLAEAAALLAMDLDTEEFEPFEGDPVVFADATDVVESVRPGDREGDDEGIPDEQFDLPEDRQPPVDEGDGAGPEEDGA